MSTFPVQKVTGLDLAFPATVKHLMPKYEDIPEEFLHWSPNDKWQKFFGDMFYHGIKIVELKPKDGIDGQDALRHLRVIAGSFEPKHEHKEAAVAYLASQWFNDIVYELLPRGKKI